MPIIQVNIWICEVCGKVVTTTDEVSPYSDPVVALDKKEGEWDFVGPRWAERLACPACFKAARE